MTGFSERLIQWYQAHKRDLPWRHTTDPYKIWLSEVILQQTRVDQGLSYYHRFIEAFPDVFALANAHEDAVLRNWQGLGYYSRARNLHATARIVAHDFKGKFPGHSRELLTLKGVGQYTAAAIASFCFNEVVPVVDGNVMRVLSRLFAVESPIDKPEGRKMIEKIANELIDNRYPALFNQAIMEFGAMQCTPGRPNCGACPFLAECAAYKNGDAERLPVKASKTVVRDLWMHYFYIVDEGEIWIRKRKDAGIWKGLYDFPLIESTGELNADDALSLFIEEYDVHGKWEKESVSTEFIHLLSHRKIHARFTAISAGKGFVLKNDGLLKVSHAAFKEYGIPRLLSRYLESRS